MAQGPRVAVIGAGEAGPELRQMAYELGQGLASLGLEVVCGGLGGVMEAVCEGARGAGGRTLGLLPGTERRAANPHVEVAVATGLGHARNQLVALNGDAVVALGGAYGTLTEIGFALLHGRPVIGLGSWELEGVRRVETVKEALQVVKEVLDPAVPTGKRPEKYRKTSRGPTMKETDG